MEGLVENQQESVASAIMEKVDELKIGPPDGEKHVQVQFNVCTLVQILFFKP